MKIEYLRDNEIKIENVNPGECFRHDGHIKMKLHCGPYKDLASKGFPNLVADIASGRLDGIADGISVVLIKVRATVNSDWGD